VKSSPFFSVIIPTFNRAELLKIAIASVLAQTYVDWELIVVDDGSTDNTAGIVSGFGDERIKYRYQVNAERSAARNKGIAHSTGQYICFLDSDDYYLPERLSMLHAELERRNFPVQVFYTGISRDVSGKVLKVESEYDTTGNIFDNIARHIIGNPQVCLSRQILEEFKYNVNFRIGEDMELWLRIAQKYPFTYLEHQHTFVVLEHDERSVNVMRYNTGAEQLKLYQFLFTDDHSGRNISKERQGYMLAAAYHTIGRYHIHQGNRWMAVRNIFMAWKSDRGSEWAKFRVNVLVKLGTFSSMEKIKELIGYH